MRYCSIYSVQGFCPLKIKITQFPDGFRLKPLKLMVPRILFYQFLIKEKGYEIC